MPRCLFPLIFLLVLVISLVYGQQRACLQLELEGNEAVVVNRYGSPQSRGLPGKQGPKGEPGVIGMPGVKGDSGSVGYDQITDIIDQKMNDIRAEFNRAINTLQMQFTQQLNALNESLSSRIQPLASCDGIEYQGRCFIFRVERMNYDEATRYCSTRNAQPANIYDQEQNNLIVNELVSVGRMLYLWTGMNVNPRTSRLTLRDGSPAAFTNWLSGTSDIGPTETQVYLYINKDSSSYNGKLGNDPASSRLNGVICEVTR